MIFTIVSSASHTQLFQASRLEQPIVSSVPLRTPTPPQLFQVSHLEPFLFQASRLEPYLPVGTVTCIEPEVATTGGWPFIEIDTVVLPGIVTKKSTDGVV